MKTRLNWLEAGMVGALALFTFTGCTALRNAFYEPQTQAAPPTTEIIRETNVVQIPVPVVVTNVTAIFTNGVVTNTEVLVVTNTAMAFVTNVVEREVPGPTVFVTNSWAIKGPVQDTVRTAGSLVPVWGDTAATGILGILSLGQYFLNRRLRKERNVKEQAGEALVLTIEELRKVVRTIPNGIRLDEEVISPLLSASQSRSAAEVVEAIQELVHRKTLGTKAVSKAAERAAQVLGTPLAGSRPFRTLGHLKSIAKGWEPMPSDLTPDEHETIRLMQTAWASAEKMSPTTGPS